VDLIKYFEQRLRECQASLRYAETPGFRLLQIVPGRAEVDITAQHIDGLRHQVAEYQEVLDSLNREA
jgi:hypothetical protein